MDQQIKKLIGKLSVGFDPSDKGHYHYCYYTSLSTLAMMLVNNRIRLSDVKSISINDLREPREFGDAAKWDRIRICCFCAGWMENNAMWGCYGHPADEAIMLRMPSSVIEGLLRGKVSCCQNLSGASWNDRAYPDKVERMFSPVHGKILRSFHDVAYYYGLRKGTDDSEEPQKYEIGFYRENVLLMRYEQLFRRGLSTIDPLIGYVKRIQWQYENESRIHLVLPCAEKRRPNVFLKLSADFFKKVAVVLGPNFNLNNDRIHSYRGVSAKDVLKEFWRRSDGGNAGRKRICESAYYGNLNYAGTKLSCGEAHMSYVWDGQELISQTAQQDSLYKRFEMMKG